MKSLFIVLVFILFTSSLFAQPADTTFTANLIKGKDLNKITVQSKIFEKLNAERQSTSYLAYTITVDGKSVSDTAEWVEFYEVQIIDIQKNDNSNEILMLLYASEDYSIRVYKLFDSPELILKADYYMYSQTDGEGNIIADLWTGFCRVSDVFKLLEDGRTMTKKEFDYYPVNIEEYYYGDDTPLKYATVVSSFDLLSERKENSDVVIKTKPGDKITITGYDFKGKITKEKIDGETVDVNWNWVQMKTADGKTGWKLMKSWDQDYWWNLLKGIMFAG